MESDNGINGSNTFIKYMHMYNMQLACYTRMQHMQTACMCDRRIKGLYTDGRDPHPALLSGAPCGCDPTLLEMCLISSLLLEMCIGSLPHPHGAPDNELG